MTIHDESPVESSAQSSPEWRSADDSLPPLPRPWRPVAAKSGSGCARPLFAGCGCLALGALLLLALVQWKRDAIIAWSIDLGRDSLMSLASPDLNSAQRTRIDHAFDTFRQAVERGQLDLETARRLNETWNQILRKAGDGPLQWGEILPLIEALEALGETLDESSPEPSMPNSPAPGRGVQA